MNKEGCIEDAFRTKAFQKINPKEKLANYQAENECPESDQLVGETVGFHQSMLLGTKQDMDDICSAIVKIHDSRQKLSSAG